MYKHRIGLYKQLESKRNSKLLVYVTGDRQGLETQIHAEVLDFFVEHLDLLSLPNKISLFLYTRGGSTLASWSIANLIMQFCEEFEVIVPSKAHSGGTLICLGANRIVMTKQATLGPIDPSVNTPLNPQIPGAPPHAKAPVSVEAIRGFIDLAKNDLKIKRDNNLAIVLTNLAEKVHPLVLGEVYRAQSQIKMLARKLLAKQIKNEEKIQRIISFLSSESGSHDYTINRKEAKEELGLSIEKPDSEFYQLIKQIYDDIRNELELNVKFDPNSVLGTQPQVNYSLSRALVESAGGGSHKFISEGVLFRRSIQVQPGVTTQGIEDQRIFEGWRHENV